jgi:SpoIIAA-like
MIKKLTDFPGNVAAFVCKGRVTRADYDAVLLPAVQSALSTHDKVRLYYETDADFAGLEAGAMWEDFKVGVEHLTRWERVAVVTDVQWIRHAVRFFGFLMPGATKLFSRSEAAQAREWILAKWGGPTREGNMPTQARLRPGHGIGRVIRRHR